MLDIEIIAKHLGIGIQKDTDVSDGVWVLKELGIKDEEEEEDGIQK